MRARDTARPSHDPAPPPSEGGGRWFRWGARGLLAVAVLLAAGLALLGELNHRRVRWLTKRALEGRALEMGLGSAAALMTLRPRGPGRLQRAVELLPDDHIRSAAVVDRRGRIIASSRAAERGQPVTPSDALERLRRGETLYSVRRLAGAPRTEHEVWIALRPGLRGRRWRHWRPDPARQPDPTQLHGGHRGFVGPGGPGPWGRGGGRHGRRWKGRPPWGRAYLRLTIRAPDAALVRATDGGWARGVTFAAAAALLLLSVLLFVADRRARRAVQLSDRQRSLAEMGGMAAVLAHEIRTPLGVIKGHAQLLAEKSEADVAEKLSLIVEQSGRLERLVNGLLDYARPGPPRPREIDARDLVEKACTLVAAEALAREVALVQDLEPTRLKADPDQLLQLVLNLLRNGLQASPDGAAVTLRLRQRSGLCLLEVLDTGPGLPNPGAEDIFKPFVSQRAGGTGLGLAVARRIAEAHGGTLRGEDGAERGARFVLTLPLSGPPEGETS